MQNNLDRPGGAPGGSNSSSVTHTGATEIGSDTELSNSTYTSVTGGENALLVTGGSVALTNPTVTKSGDESSESSDFYGTNAAVLVSGGNLTISGGSITTSGSHANALFSYNEGAINVTNMTIKTSGNNSGGIMVTGGGTLLATDTVVETSGNSSAAIRSDRGGGVVTVAGGSYTTSGVGSPALYSTASISVNGAKLISIASEGVVIEGSNSVTLFDATLTDTNTTLNGNSETYKNIFIYQSMSGDAEEGTGSFSAFDSQITTNKGDTFFVTNTTAEISLQNNRIINNDETSAFLRAQAGKWGTSGSNGGIVTLAAENQVIEGDIILDNISSLTMSLTSSYYMGVINGANTARSVSVTLDANSNLVLAGDTYLSSLTNADVLNKNIYSNGCKLYVDGSEVSINGSEAPEVPEVIVDESETEDATTTAETTGTTETSTNYLPFIVGGAAILIIIVAVVAMVLHEKKKKQVPPAPTLPPDNPFHPTDGGPGIDVPENGPGMVQ